jgi:hypothetical protein
MEQKPTEQGEQKESIQPPAAETQQKKSSNKTLLIVLVVIAVLGAITLVGGYFVVKIAKTKISEKVGQKIGENIIERAIEQGVGENADVNAEDGSVSIKTDSGTFAASESGNIKLPSDFPTDVFTYPDAKIKLSTTNPADSTEGTEAFFMVAYSVNRSVADVISKYKEEMAKNGWTLKSEANYGGMMINFKKGTREIFLTISEDQEGKNGTTTVSLTSSGS